MAKKDYVIQIIVRQLDEETAEEQLLNIQRAAEIDMMDWEVFMVEEVRE